MVLLLRFLKLLVILREHLWTGKAKWPVSELVDVIWVIWTVLKGLSFTIRTYHKCLLYELFNLLNMKVFLLLPFDPLFHQQLQGLSFSMNGLIIEELGHIRLPGLLLVVWPFLTLLLIILIILSAFSIHCSPKWYNLKNLKF